MGGIVLKEGKYSTCGETLGGDEGLKAYSEGSGEKLKEILEQKSVTYVPEDISAFIGHKPSPACRIWHYDKDNNVYAYYDGSCGGNTSCNLY